MGQFVNVQGNFQGRGVTIVLIVVNIVVNIDAANVESTCYWKESGMGN